MAEEDLSEEIFSYEEVFSVRHRIHKVQEFTLPRPVEVTSVLWVAGGIILIFLLSRLPLIGYLVTWIPAEIRYIVLPIGLAILAGEVKGDGRGLIGVVWGWLIIHLRTAPYSMGRAVQEDGHRIDWDCWVARDQRSPELRSARIVGPAHVEFQDPMRVRKQRNGKVKVFRAKAKKLLGATHSLDLEEGQLCEVKS
jgi:hypothetical protein